MKYPIQKTQTDCFLNTNKKLARTHKRPLRLLSLESQIVPTLLALGMALTAAPFSYAAESAQPALKSPLANKSENSKTTSGTLAVVGELASVQGVVFVRQDGRGSGGPPKPAKAGDPIRQNDVINTSSGGSVKILLVDKTIIDVGPSALFKMDKFSPNGGSDREVEMNMLYGTIRGSVTQKITGKGKFHLRTPTATMGVRGTEFVVKSEVKDLKEVQHGINKPGTAMAQEKPKPGEAAKPTSTSKTEITVLQGKVEVASKPQDLGKPQASGSKATSAVALSAGQQLTTSQVDKAPPKAVTLDTKSLSALQTSSRIMDNTFKNAVVIDLGAGSGSGSSGSNSKTDSTPGAGAATLAILETALAMPELPPMTMGDLGISGTFGITQNAFAPAAAIPQANTIVKESDSASKRIRIVITQ